MVPQVTQLSFDKLENKLERQLPAGKLTTVSPTQLLKQPVELKKHKLLLPKVSNLKLKSNKFKQLLLRENLNA
jgi:hypothetical protein